MSNEDSQPTNVGSNDGLGAGAEARFIYLASDMRSPHGSPRFEIVNGGKGIVDEDFIFDAQLTITGDFTEEQREAYAQWIANALNAADAKLLREPRGA